MTYPMTRSNCCWRMFEDILHSTRPVLKVIAKACAISSCIVKGMLLFLFAGPTQISVEPLCSNSLVPNCANSALETRDKTTLVGNLSSIAASTPNVWVVLMRDLWVADDGANEGLESVGGRRGGGGRAELNPRSNDFSIDDSWILGR